MKVNKHQSVLDWLMRYEPLKDLFFNFSQAENNNVALLPVDSDAVISTNIDGSREREYTFAVVWYKDFTTAETDTDRDVNIAALFDVESFMDWIDGQESSGNYPDFGANCTVWSVQNLQDIPRTEGENLDKNLARYIFSCKINYLEEKVNA